MTSKATRIIVASIALAGLVGFAAPVEAAPSQTARTGWCC